MSEKKKYVFQGVELQTGDYIVVGTGRDYEKQNIGFVCCELDQVIYQDGDYDELSELILLEDPRFAIAVLGIIRGAQGFSEALDPYGDGEIIYERPQPKRMTKQEIIQALGHDFLLVD